MAKLPVLSARKIIKILTKAGFALVSQKGSHIKLKRTVGDKTWIVIVPNFGEVPFGTLASIIRQSGLEKDEFFKRL
jgi:predicted RNA binding protein YcfA (HicA-like mRNA interferase family)